MNLSSNAKQLPRQFLLAAIGALLLLGMALGAVFFYYTFYNQQNTTKTLQERTYATVKNNLQSRVLAYVQRFEDHRRFAEQRILGVTKQRTLEAYATIEQIYLSMNGKYSQAEIKQNILSVLSNLRYNDDRDYFFVIDTNGKSLVTPADPELTGRSMKKVQDANGKYFVQEFIDVALKYGEGSVSYTWHSPQSPDTNYPKVSYIKLFKPFNWMIGHGRYYNNIQQEQQQQVCNLLNSDPYNNISILQVDSLNVKDPRGTIVVLPPHPQYIGTEIDSTYIGHGATSKMKTLFAELKNNKQSFLTYQGTFAKGESGPRLAFFMYYTPWNWIVTSSVDLEHSNNALLLSTRAARHKLWNHLFYAALIIIAITSLTVLLLIALSSRFRKLLLHYQLIQQQKAQELAQTNNELLIKVEQYKQATQELRRINNYISDVLIYADASGHIQYVSPSFTRLLGYQEHEMQNQQLWDKIHPKERNLVKLTYKNSLGHPIIPCLRFRYRHQKGWWVWLEIEGGFEADPDTGEYAAIIRAKDVSEHEVMHGMLRRQEQLNRAIIKYAPIGISVRDKNGTLVLHNRAWENIWQFTPEQVEQYYHKRTALTFDERDNYLGLHLNQVRAVYSKGGQYLVPQLKTRKPKPGKAEWISQHFFAITDKDGQVENVVIITTDISDRMHTMQQLNLLQAAIDQAAEGVVITNVSGQVMYVNTALCGITGYSTKEIIGNNMRMFKSGHHDQSFYESMWGTLLSGKTFIGHITNKRKDGSLYVEDAVLSPVRDAQNEIAWFVAVKKDVTQELAYKQQLERTQRLNSIGTIASGVAHDFNNILMSMFGHAYLLDADKTKSPDAKDTLQDLRYDLNRAKDLVQQILNFGRDSQNTLIQTDVKVLLEDMLRLFKVALPSSINLVTNLQPVGKIHCNPVHMQQVVMNLCNNARDALAGAGQITVKLNLADAPPLGSHPGVTSWICLCVADTGQGMTQSVMEKIFQPLFTTKKVGEGTGLGLATVKQIVTQNGGRISVISTPGTGSEFTILLPVLLPDSTDKEL